MTTCYLNGTFMPRSEARVSPMDRGFLFGDGVYELIPVYAHRPFRLAQHLARLDNSLAGIALANPLDTAQWHELVRELIRCNEWPDQAVYLQVTRGTQEVRNHVFPANTRPTVFATSDPLAPVSAELRARGASVISAEDFRWTRCDLKTTALLANCLLRQQAVEQGCAETVLFRDGLLTEGSSSNIFVVRDGVLLAPPKSRLMLPGITYDVVLELAARHGLAHEVRDIAEHEVREADELWMTSSSREVLPITRLDNVPVGNGQPGPVGARMQAWYDACKFEEKHCG